MKIFFAVKNDAGLDSKIDSRFGRAAYFLIFDTEKEEIESLEKNPFLSQAHGVGIQVGNHVIQQKCQIVVGPKFGPKVEEVLKAANIELIISENSPVKEILKKIKSGS
jgi:predicted Fe-Mo cluster-binding NifX family protein